MDRPSPVPSPAGLVVKNGIEQLLLHLRGDTGAVVADSDLDAVTEVLGRRSQRGLVVASICLRFTLRRRVEAVGDQVEQRPRDLLREQIDLASGRIKGPLQGDIEALLLGPRSVIGEIEALLDEGVDIDRAGALLSPDASAATCS